MAERVLVGWDIGGAHVKACLLRNGLVHDAAQWPCPLWQGSEQLDSALALARRRWPELADAQHAVTMTAEMVDLFAQREDGVRAIAAQLAAALGQPQFFAGDAGWCSAADAAANWAQIASANWLACARHTALSLTGESGVLVDIGSTTTDLIAFAHGQVPTTSRTDAQRLARSELVYQGVVRTPLCAITQRIAWRGDELNVMNELFATSADVYRLTGELDRLHDQQPSADNAAKDLGATRARLARMIGLDARDGSSDEWLDFAQRWRALQVAELRGQLDRLIARQGLRTPALLVGAGCGAFLLPELAPPRWRCASYGRDVARVCAQAAPGSADWAGVCAPSVAVAALFDRDQS
jgi:(4-(4-[2-(gamma-L-glutamylamino)ethyl]phenoxymethyl)furan-2-yl)methanamine synthase